MTAATPSVRADLHALLVTLTCALASLACWQTPAATASEPDASEPKVPAAVEGPLAAWEFERSFRDFESYRNSLPVRFDRCENITEMTADLWSKKQVLTDFKKNRTPEQVGAIVFVKTEYCCDGSRLCAVTTACLEKKSTPLVGRFRVYAGWIKNNPDHPYQDWSQWDRDVIDEYHFIQGPGARVVVMVPIGNGQMYQWHSTATDLELSELEFDQLEGQTPKLEKFLAEAVKYAPARPLLANNWPASLLLWSLAP